MNRKWVAKMGDHWDPPNNADLLANYPAPVSDRFFDDPPEECADFRTAQADAVLRVLYLLTNQQHPGLRLAADCLLAIVNRSEEKSLAAIARKHGLTRSAVSKRMRDIRFGRTLAGNVDCFFFGGNPEVSKKARERALRVHARNKDKNAKPIPACVKTTPGPSKLQAALFRFWRAIRNRPPEKWEREERQEFLLDLAERERLRKKQGWELPCIE